MGFLFKKNKNGTDTENELDTEFVLPFEENIAVPRADELKIKPKAPHALTAEEVKSSADGGAVEYSKEQISLSGGETKEVNAATALLYKRMMQSKNAPKNDFKKHEKQPDLYKTAPKAEEKSTEEPVEQKSTDVEKIIENIKQNDEYNQPTENKNPATHPVGETPSLLSRCMPYIIDDNGHNHSEDFPPAYTLESVEDIIRSFENKAQKTVSILYSDKIASAPKPMLKKQNENTANVQNIPMHADAPKSGVLKQSSENSIKTYQASFSTIDIPVLSSENNGEATVTFNINDIRRATGDSLGNTRQVFISDIGEEKTENIKDVIAPKSADFDEIIDDLNGYTCVDDAKRVRRELYGKKKGNLIRLILTGLLALFIGVIRIDSISALFNSSDLVLILSTAALTLTCIINHKMIASVFKIFKGCNDVKIPVGLSALTVLIHSLITLAFFDSSKVLNLTPIAALILAFSSLSEFLHSAMVVDNFRFISNNYQKNTVEVIKDTDTSSKIISTGLEGKPFIAASRKTVNILGFLKDSDSPGPLAGKMPLFTGISLAAALIFAAASFFINGDISVALSVFTVVICLMSPPTTMLIGTALTKRMNVRLNRMSAMVSGYESAMQIEPTNSVVLNAFDLFPKGTVKLINMKVLDNNALDKTFLDAASLTLSAKSPLCNVFKEITKTLEDATLPVCDSVKFEDKMGVSGWVNDRHIFIGNRTLLEAHGIAVPSVEIDKKILKKGYFPVYVACNGSPYALLMVKYEVDSLIANQLTKLNLTGVTFYLASTDPNVNAQMVTDYFGLYDDSVYMLKNEQIASYKSALNYKESCFAPACFNGGIEGHLGIVRECIKLKISVNVMTVLHILGAIIGVFAAVFAIFSGAGHLVSVMAILLWQIAWIIISYFATLIK